jgi:hypothetical protein
MSDQDPREPDPDPPELPAGTGLWLVLTLIVSLAIILAQLAPFDFGAPRGPLLGLAYTGPWLLLLQVVLFVPLGAVEGELARRVLGGWRAGGWGSLLVGLDAALLALICETVQYWIASRTSSIVDVVAAALGGVAGYMLLTLWQRG